MGEEKKETKKLFDTEVKTAIAIVLLFVVFSTGVGIGKKWGYMEWRGKAISFHPKNLKENVIYRVIDFGRLIEVEEGSATQDFRVFSVLIPNLDAKEKFSNGTKFSIQKDISSGSYYVEFYDKSERIKLSD